MTKKKDHKVSISQADEAQAQALLGQVHQIAKELHTSTDQKQAETALTPVTNLSEAAQMALLKALSKEHHTDAADVLTAINELAPNKNVRKEARRSLIRLEEVRIYPQWQAPIERVPPIAALEVPANPPRFWKGVVTDSRDIGEVQLMLLWEQGEDYRDVRVLGFLLELWHDGVKDFFTRVESKRSVEKLMEEMSSRVETLDCSLAKGRRLIEEALEVNKKFGTMPHKDYRMHLSLVKQLVLDVPGLEDEEEEEDLEDQEDFDEEEEAELEEDEDDYSLSSDLEPIDIVTNFVEEWVDGDYEYAYSFLSSDSPLREGLSRDEWAERRYDWADDADPVRLVPSFIHEREPQKTGIWLPNPFSRGRSTTTKEIETGWSIELADTSSTNPLPELPQATAVYAETGRHWFWISYTLVKEQDGWRIQSITDEFANAQGLPVEELRKRITQHDDAVTDITTHHSPNDPDALQYFEEMLWHMMQSICYDDVLLQKLPHEREIYADAAARATLFGEPEHALVYLERMAQLFTEQQAEVLQQIAALQIQVSEKNFEEEDEESDERGERFQDLAVATLRESLNFEDSALAHILLAGILIDKGSDEDLDEAEDHLHQAQGLTTDQTHQAIIETDLGGIGIEREDYEEALPHFQRVVEIDPNFANGWYNIGQAQQGLGDDEGAKDSYRRAIELEPENVMAYTELADIYVEADQIPEARQVLEKGIQANPESAELLTLLSATYIESDLRHAEELLKKAESIDPGAEIVLMYRQIINMRKQSQRLPSGKKPKPKKKR